MAGRHCNEKVCIYLLSIYQGNRFCLTPANLYPGDLGIEKKLYSRFYCFILKNFDYPVNSSSGKNEPSTSSTAESLKKMQEHQRDFAQRKYFEMCKPSGGADSWKISSHTSDVRGMSWAEKAWSGYLSWQIRRNYKISAYQFLTCDLIKWISFRDIFFGTSETSTFDCLKLRFHLTCISSKSISSPSSKYNLYRSSSGLTFRAASKSIPRLENICLYIPGISNIVAPRSNLWPSCISCPQRPPGTEFFSKYLHHSPFCKIYRDSDSTDTSTDYYNFFRFSII